ncbi:hypothetical protein V2J09_003124 [Rumex salicifolius]
MATGVERSIINSLEDWNLEAIMKGKEIVSCATVEDSRAEANIKLLHGTLEVTVFHATLRSKTSSWTPSCLSLNGQPAYVEIKLNQETIATTSHEKERVWNQTFQILCAHPLDSTITINVRTRCSILGALHFKARQLVEEASFISGFFPLFEGGSKKPSKKHQLQLILWFKPAELEATWEKSINHGGFHGLRNSTFPLRSNCGVTLYHDAHHHASFQPPTSVTNPRNLWEDVYRAFEDAKHLIYIAGWSLNPNLVLIRDPQTNIQHGKGVKLGELLKRKAEEGVAVRIMLWDDETSMPFIKNKGLMKTHDEDASAYFKNTKVVCRLCPRLHNKFPTLFSHHQKTVTLDGRVKGSDCSINHREIISFVGGVDLCDGRYDTEEHSLFKALNKESHCQDFYQTSIQGASLERGGPREAWHDAHACVTGPAARDVLNNFEQRWSKQCDPSLLVPPSTINDLFTESEMGDSSNKNWKVQVFRSIDHFSVTPSSSRAPMTEQSIHEAYVEAIRRADRFIYIENQYFVGGCSLWGQDQHSGCKNLIPIEIALKIASKIRARQRFAAYILIPMWPEGVPESDSVQDILHWTKTTMSMMYGIIAQALKEVGEQGHPKDYLNFFCLANREEKVEGEMVPPLSPHPGTQYWYAQENRRFMIYVHAKIMIVDDMYMMIGSANVNQRSMDGARDTEIGIGCYQTDNDGRGETNGDIMAYRMSLWYEHTGRAHKTYMEPESLDCVEMMRTTGEKTSEIYCRDELVDMKGVHLISYPVRVSQDGCVGDTVMLFPDTQTPVGGRRSMILPPILTT